MHPRVSQSLGKFTTALVFIIVAAGLSPVWGDDTGLLGRLFRMGGGSSDSSTSSARPNQSAPLPYGRDPSTMGSAVPPAAASPLAPSPMISNFNGLPQAPVATPPVADGPGQRLAPKPRVSPAVTTADPLLTRLALGRSNDGSQFGMFLQVFADGTVIDSDGVHHIRAADLRPIVDAVQEGDLYRVRGHCGAPSTDFIEYVHVVIYERRLGRLSAHSFSYSGSTQGCDQSVRQLHTILENLQAKMSRQSNPSQTGPSPTVTPEGSNPLPGGPAPAFGPHIGNQPTAPAVNPGSGSVIPLTPVDRLQ
jgi:hypothetical protein